MLNKIYHIQCKHRVINLRHRTANRHFYQETRTVVGLSKIWDRIDYPLCGNPNIYIADYARKCASQGMY